MKSPAGRDIVQESMFSNYNLVIFRIAVNFGGSPVELNFKPSDKALSQPLCKRKGAVVDVLV